MRPMVYVAMILAAMVGITEHWLALPAAAYMGWHLHRLYTRWDWRRRFRGVMPTLIPDHEANRAADIPRGGTVLCDGAYYVVPDWLPLGRIEFTRADATAPWQPSVSGRPWGLAEPVAGAPDITPEPEVSHGS